MSTLHPANVATPATAALGLVAHVRAAPPGLVSARATGVEAVVTVFPSASRRVTTGWVAKAVPPVELEGLVLKASLSVVTAEMTKLALTAEMSPVAVAVTV